MLDLLIRISLPSIHYGLFHRSFGPKTWNKLKAVFGLSVEVSSFICALAVNDLNDVFERVSFV